MPVQIVHQDITTIVCDAIVNPTDHRFSGSGGTDRAIHKAAGFLLDQECRRLEALSLGQVTVTGAYDLPCSYIIHTIGPVWHGGRHNEEILLRSCYINALFKAAELQMHSIAFPLISSGTFGFPKDKVLRIALASISSFLNQLEDDLEVTICIYSPDAYTIQLRRELKTYLHNEQRPMAPAAPLWSASRRSPPLFEAPSLFESAPPEEDLLCDSANDTVIRKTCSADDVSLDDWLKKQDDSFAVTLLKLIDKKGITDVECYKKANVGKKTFWKINNDPKYRPSKPTVIAFAIALKLTLPETEALLKTVGFSLSHSNTFDMIIEFYIRRGIYDIHEINAALFQFDQICLGC